MTDSQRVTWTQLILITIATTGGGVLFQAGVLLRIEDVQFWPILAAWSQIYALFGAVLQA